MNTQSTCLGFAAGLEQFGKLNWDDEFDELVDGTPSSQQFGSLNWDDEFDELVNCTPSSPYTTAEDYNDSEDSDTTEEPSEPMGLNNNISFKVYKDQLPEFTVESCAMKQPETVEPSTRVPLGTVSPNVPRSEQVETHQVLGLDQLEPMPPTVEAGHFDGHPGWSQTFSMSWDYRTATPPEVALWASSEELTRERNWYLSAVIDEHFPSSDIPRIASCIARAHTHWYFVPEGSGIRYPYGALGWKDSYRHEGGPPTRFPRGAKGLKNTWDQDVPTTPYIAKGTVRIPNNAPPQGRWFYPKPSRLSQVETVEDTTESEVAAVENVLQNEGTVLESGPEELGEESEKRSNEVDEDDFPLQVKTYDEFYGPARDHDGCLSDNSTDCSTHADSDSAYHSADSSSFSEPDLDEDTSSLEDMSMVLPEDLDLPETSFQLLDIAALEDMSMVLPEDLDLPETSSQLFDIAALEDMSILLPEDLELFAGTISQPFEVDPSHSALATEPGSLFVLLNDRLAAQKEGRCPGSRISLSVMASMDECPEAELEDAVTATQVATDSSEVLNSVRKEAATTAEVAPAPPTDDCTTPRSTPATTLSQDTMTHNNIQPPYYTSPSGIITFLGGLTSFAVTTAWDLVKMNPFLLW